MLDIKYNVIKMKQYSKVTCLSDELDRCFSRETLKLSNKVRGRLAYIGNQT